MKYWEIIADNLKKAGWGCVSAVDSRRRTIWIADAHRGDGKRFVVREPMKSRQRLSKSKRRFALAVIFLDTEARFFKTRRRQPISNQAEGLPPARFFVSSGPATNKINPAGKREEEP